MNIEKYYIEGLEIEVEKPDENDDDAKRRFIAFCVKAIRNKTGLNRKEFSDWLGIPYRTMQEWELGRRTMPEYVLRLLAYRVSNELSK